MIMCGTGPLAAGFNAADRDHALCSALLRGKLSRLVIPSPAVTGVCHLLADLHRRARTELAAEFCASVAADGLRVIEAPERAAPSCSGPEQAKILVAARTAKTTGRLPAVAAVSPRWRAAHRRWPSGLNMRQPTWGQSRCKFGARLGVKRRVQRSSQRREGPNSVQTHTRTPAQTG